ncbi:MAG: amidohydrolase [Chloroflexota bacterium]|nr:MAG: amidohydrolase [Chloroflexota bacterium]
MMTSGILKNGRIHTQDESLPKATAVALSGDRIIGVGSDEDMLALASGDSQVIDLGGRCVTPGLVDAHVHFQGYSLGLNLIDLSGSVDLNEALDRVAAAKQQGAFDRWLTGRGWNQAEWPDGRFPRAADLDRASGALPALLKHKSGHAAWANTRALRLAAITAETLDPPGGQIQRDGDGQPTGILFESAIDLVNDRIPRPSEAELVEAMKLGQQKCLEAGLTGVHDFDGRACFGALQTLHQEGALSLRIVKNIPVKYLDHATGIGLHSGFGDDWLRIGGVKMFADGALGPRTATMLAPYEGEPENRGIVVTDKEEMMAYASQACASGLSLTVHAIGDRANHDVLDVYEALRTQERERNVAHEPGATRGRLLRHRIEHFQIAHPTDFERLAALEVVASMQPIHATSDMEMADRYWGGRAKNSYAWRRVLQAGGILALGSDAPVEPIEPLTGIHAAITRQRPDGSPGPRGWYPEQRLSMAEAIHGFTLGPALACGRETLLGSITAGKLADLTIFEQDIYQIPAADIVDVQIAGTIVGGQFKFRSW